METIEAQIKHLIDTRHDVKENQPDDTSATSLIVNELDALWDGLLLLAKHLDEKAS